MSEKLGFLEVVVVFNSENTCFDGEKSRVSQLTSLALLRLNVGSEGWEAEKWWEQFQHEFDTQHVRTLSSWRFQPFEKY